MAPWASNEKTRAGAGAARPITIPLERVWSRCVRLITRTRKGILGRISAIPLASVTAGADGLV
jgi:hypothetical protein